MGYVFDDVDRVGPPESWAAPFRKALSLRGRPESRLKWYFIWAPHVYGTPSDACAIRFIPKNRTCSG